MPRAPVHALSQRGIFCLCAACGAPFLVVRCKEGGWARLRFNCCIVCAADAGTRICADRLGVEVPVDGAMRFDLPKLPISAGISWFMASHVSGAYMPFSAGPQLRLRAWRTHLTRADYAFVMVFSRMCGRALKQSIAIVNVMSLSQAGVSATVIATLSRQPAASSSDC